ncbi:MAG: class I SAM-dependent methyltransferase [Pseudomonadales bacterium]
MLNLRRFALKNHIVQLAACATLISCAATADVPPATSQAEIITAAVTNPNRPEKDTVRDTQRKPADILQFFSIQPGQSVLDMYSGGGYYTEMLSYTVGEKGRVVAHNNTVYAGMTAEERAIRYGDDRLNNVEVLIAPNNALILPTDAFDVVLFSLAYHDIYYIDGFRGWEKVDRPAMLAQVFAATRAGGTVGVIDHIAQADADPAVVPKLHRIDPELIKRDFLAAGFVFESESDVLLNTEDDLKGMAMMPAYRGKTSRAVLKFSKP